MINVNQITAQMARMSDPALQQYAAMHKSDPYTLSLALSESNRRKQMRQGAQMGQQQPQPKVVDQEIAQMGPQMPPQQGMPPQGMPQGMPPQQLPENVGIGQLPAPNMQRMAEGGIVAFEEGGEVPRFQEGGNWASKLKEMFGGDPEELSPLERIRLAYLRSQEERKSVKAGANPFSLEGQAALPGSAAYMATEQATRGMMPPAAPAAPAVPPPPPAAGGLPPPPPAAGGAPAGPGLPSIVKPRVPELAPEIKALNTNMPTARQAQGIAAQFLDEDKYAQQLKDLTNEEAASIAERRIKLEKSLKDMPERYKDYEGRLKAQEKEDAGDKEKLTGMSFLEAGLAVLSGESPNAFVNLGRAKEGVKTYNEGIKDIKRSVRERDKAFADIENARQAQAEGKIDKMQAFEDNAAKSLSDSKRFAVSGMQNLGLKGAELAKNTYDVLTNNAFANQRTVAGAAQALQTTDLSGQYGLAAAQTQAGATMGAARLRAETDRETTNALRQGQLNVTTLNAIEEKLAKFAKDNRYTPDDPEYHTERQRLVRLYTAANPGMAQSGRAPGGGADPLGIR